MPGHRQDGGRDGYGRARLDSAKSALGINDLDVYEDYTSKAFIDTSSDSSLVDPNISNSSSVQTSDACSFGDLGFNKLY